jgi:uncharacterized protein YbjT (DUF2867 family)
MFAITGVTGKVGGAVARSLLAQGHKVRAVVRDAEKGRSWAAQGCEIAIASVEDATGLTKALHGVEGVFCGFRSMWAVDSSGCGHRKRSDVGSDSVVMWAGKSN